MKVEIDNPVAPFDENEQYCCMEPSYECESAVDKLHQARGYVEWECENCGEIKQVDYRLRHKLRVNDGETFDKNATDLGTCDEDHHLFVGGQTTIREDEDFYVKSECENCDLVIHDIFEKL